MYVEEGSIWYINLFIIALVLFSIAAFMVIYNLSGGEKFSTLQGPPTLTGARMPCNNDTQCAAGLSCISTSLGHVCLAQPGGPCNSLYECDYQATICNGRCVQQKGSVGDYCTLQSDCSGTLICAGEVGNQRCLIPQGQAGCTNFYDCVPNSTCDAGTCRVGKAPYETCVNSYECAGSNNCLAGRCQPLDISVPGSVGAYCDAKSSECLTNLECQESSDFNLPTDIGYCARIQAQLGSSCNRFVGCVPVGECVNAKCILPPHINDCSSEKCSGSYTCVNEVCLGANDSAPCAIGSDCQSGTCGNASITSLTYGGNTTIYNWHKLYSSPIPDLLSMYETINSNIVYQNVGAWYYNSPFNLTIYQPNNLIATSFTFDAPSGYVVSEVSGIKIFQGFNFVFDLQIQNNNTTYHKLILRNYPLPSGITTTVNLSTDEVQQYSPGIQTITFFTYDYVDRYLYFISNSADIYSINLNVSNANPVKNDITASPVTFVVHFTRTFDIASTYNPNDILTLGYLNRTEGDGNGWYLFSTPLNIFISLNSYDINIYPQVALSFSTSNTIDNYSFFYYNSVGYAYVQSVANEVTQYPVAGYISDKVNIIQSLATSNFMVASTATC